MIDTGDTIRVKSSGEVLLVACVHDVWIHTCGYPEMRYRLCDVELVEQATPQRRREQIERLAASSGTGHRVKCAREKMTAMQLYVGEADA